MAPLESVSATSFFEQDARPTAVVDVTDQTSAIHYANPAFLRLRDQTAAGTAQKADEELASFVTWAKSTVTSGAHEYTAWQLTWTSFLLEERWVVATCSYQDRHRLANVQREAAPSAESSAVSGSLGSTRSNPKPVIDWTVEDLPNISEYVKWFKAFDWSATPLGPLKDWPPTLRRLTVMIISAPEPRLILWGSERITVYNEACIPLIGQKHPHALGRGPEGPFKEFWAMVDPVIVAAEHGTSTKIERMPLPMVRNGFEEECFFDFLLQPVCGPDGRVAGILDSITESTETIVAERRMSLITQLGEISVAADDLEDFWKRMIGVLADKTEDVPFALLYEIDNLDSSSDGQSSSSRAHSSEHGLELPNVDCILQGSIGAQLHRHLRIDRFNLFQEESGSIATLVAAIRNSWTSRTPVMLSLDDGSMPSFLQNGVSGRAGGMASSQAVVIPIPSLTNPTLVGVVLVGLTSRRPYDASYQQFIRLLSDRIVHSVASISIPKEHRLAQAASAEAALEHASLSRQLLQRTQEAERREAKFARLYENAPVGMYLLRSDGSPIYLNEAYSRITGLVQPEKLLYDTTLWRDQIITEDVKIVEDAWSMAFRDKGPFLIEYRLKRPWHSYDEATGTRIEGTTWLRASGFPDVDDEGNVASMVGWVSDISLQKWSEKLQQKRLEEALEAKIQSERFIDTVSHEIRNPLSAILQSADGILASMKKIKADDSTSAMTEIDASAESAQTIVFCTQHQKRIVDDILTFSKLDSNLIVLAPEATSPGALLDRALSMFAAELQAADIMATIEGNKDDIQVICDSSRILQVLINLLTNAIKFTRGCEKRQIVLSLHKSSQPPRTLESGTKFIPRRKSRATGSFNDDWGEGDEVFLSFTVKDTGKGLTQTEMDQLFHRFAQASPRTYSQYGGSGLGLFISKELCELHGGQIGVSSVAGEGSAFTFFVRAVTIVPQSLVQRSSRRPSLVETKFTSRIAGDEAADVLLQAPVSTQVEDLPVPSLGTYSPPEIVQTRKAEHVRLKAADLNLLIVEDNLINQSVMAKQLRLAGCRVYLANHGGEALDFLRRSSYATSPGFFPAEPLSAILMDVEMPVMDGLTAARRIREMQQTGELKGHVPIAAVTANARSSQLSDTLNAGMDIVVTKPFRIAEIMPQILALVEDKMVSNRDPVWSAIGPAT